MLISQAGAVIVNPETMEMDRVISDSLYIDRLYLIEDSCHVKCCRDDADDEEFDAEPGDVIAFFWKDSIPHKTIIVKSEELKDNIEFHRAERQKQKEAWAAKKAEMDKQTSENDD